MRGRVLSVICLFIAFSFEPANAVEKVNFDLNWKFIQKDVDKAQEVSFGDKNWRMLNLPHDWSVEGEYRETENRMVPQNV